ncbi:redoxin [Leptolyngbya sp. 'hensonii']|uniref:thioredoxin family protein n=1 Tax=Leptolyngbya sp. 'hensonii' TaxID=1922337 RepID=UPI00094FBAD6|nr:thioredoxin family protein [Leptolyngbya sp. 'hensonii']OLP16952.1 redoxin [Leptolyngbya sp. 'hensonii']
MDRPFLRRRQMLMYLGLGAVATGVTATVLHRARTTTTNTATPVVVPELPQSSPVNVSTGEMVLPEFQGITDWLNSAPLTIAGLKGKVVLLQFWTFGCINCQRTLPYITRWHQQYGGQGLQVIGVHTPEFAYEREINNIKAALKQHKITYPVPIDNAFKTWNAYQNEYWPHLFLADRQGIIRYDRIGEGAYDRTEQMIRQLLA